MPDALCVASVLFVGCSGSQMIMAMFVIWALVKVCIIGYYWALRCMGKVRVRLQIVAG